MKKSGLNRISFLFGYILYLLVILIIFDIFILHNLLGFGYPRHYQEENIYRYPAPYVGFTGKPNVLDHNKYGFRGHSFDDAENGDIKIAFFGGSTGYFGNPPIADMLEKKLSSIIKSDVFVANFSVVSSNHRQHLHSIIEYISTAKPDIVVFYGGYNELIQPGKYDPRPGYPYNYFYREETCDFYKLLLAHSAVIGEIDKKTGFFTGINRLRRQENLFSDDWNNRIINNYFETLDIANKITKTLKSNVFGKTRFIAFYQPYQVGRYEKIHKIVKNRINKINYIYDVSYEYDILGKGVYSDVVHVNQRAKEVMAEKISNIIARKFFIKEIEEQKR